MRAPRTKEISARRTTRLRPRESARIPEMGEMRSANREVHEVISDLSMVVNS